MSDGLPSISQLNIALAKALGVTDTQHLAGLDLAVRPGALPVVTARFHLRTPEGLQQVVDSWDLAPQRQAITADEVRDAA